MTVAPSERAEGGAARHPWRVLVAALPIMVLLGSLYAWSLFLAPLESALGAGRAAVSSVFALATIAFAVSMVIAPALFHRQPASRVALLACLLAAAGLALGGLHRSLLAVQLGSGVLFGVANGIGYGLALQLVNDAFRRRRGLATGAVVAAYALGAVVFAPAFRWGLAGHGPWATLLAMAAVFTAAGGVLWVLLRPIRAVGAPVPRLAGDAVGGRLFWLLWTGFLCGAAAGLMALGHAAGLAAAYGGPNPAMAAGTALIAAGNAFGRLVSGWLSDHLPVRTILAAAAAIGAAALFALAGWPGPASVLACLALVGLAYGLLAAGYVVATAAYYGADRVAAVFGRLFTAWGLAGLAAPVLAGAVVDRTGDYRLAVVLAAVSALVSAGCALLLPGAKR
jgi:MFS family permease